MRLYIGGIIQNQTHLYRDAIKYAVMNWIFSAQAYLYLKERYGSAISMLFFNRLVAGDDAEGEKLNSLFSIPGNSFQFEFSTRKPSFTYRDGLFLCPTGGKYERLMTVEDICFVEHFTGPFLKKLGLENWGFAHSNKMLVSGEHDEFSRYLDYMLLLHKSSLYEAKGFIDKNMAISRDIFRKKKRYRWVREVKRNLRNLLRLFSGWKSSS